MPVRSRSCFRFVLCVAAFALSPACTTRPSDPGDTGPLFDVDAAPGDAGRDALPIDAPPFDAGPRLDDVLVYAHSRDTLFSFDPVTETVLSIAPFRLDDGTAAPFMLDLA